MTNTPIQKDLPIHDGLKSRMLWLTVGAVIFVLSFSAYALHADLIDGDQWVSIVQWVPVTLIAAFGGREAWKVVSKNGAQKEPPAQIMGPPP